MLKDSQSLILNPLECSKLGVALIAFSSYLALVRLLRWRRYNALQKKWTGRELSSITPEEAQTILHTCTLWDMPALHVYSLSFALFKTYAVPTISKILANTKEFSSKDLVSKRYADTEILIGTWINCPIAGRYDLNKTSQEAEIDPRAMIALARVNFLHSKYPVSNEDYLYTLSLFAVEPTRWAKQYGWRALSPLECQAFFIFWREIGKRMKIRDIPETLEGLIEWSQSYEQEHMIPTTSNRDVAEYTIDELLHSVPATFGIKAFATRIVICVLEERVRISMMQPEQPKYLRDLAHGVLISWGYFQRYLCLPRLSPESLVEMGPPKTPGPVPRMHPNRWRAKPWYKPEGTGISLLLNRLAVMVGYYDVMPDRQFRSEGYRLEELGPLPKENMAHEEIMKNAAELQGCPVTGPWSLNGGR